MTALLDSLSQFFLAQFDSQNKYTRIQMTLPKKVFIQPVTAFKIKWDVTMSSVHRAKWLPKNGWTTMGDSICRDFLDVEVPILRKDCLNLKNWASGDS